MNRKRSLRWWAALGLTGVWLYLDRAKSYARLHPDLHSPLLRFRSPPFAPAIVSLMRTLPVTFSPTTDVQVGSRRIRGPLGEPDVTVYLYRSFMLREMPLRCSTSTAAVSLSVRQGCSVPPAPATSGSWHPYDECGLPSRVPNTVSGATRGLLCGPTVDESAGGHPRHRL